MREVKISRRRHSQLCPLIPKSMNLGRNSKSVLADESDHTQYCWHIFTQLVLELNIKEKIKKSLHFL